MEGTEYSKLEDIRLSIPEIDNELLNVPPESNALRWCWMLNSKDGGSIICENSTHPIDSVIENISIDPEYVGGPVGSSGKLSCLKLNSKLCGGNTCENSIHCIGPLNDSKLSSGPPENAGGVGASEGAGVERECPITSFQIDSL